MLALLGGARSAKTHLLCSWGLRRWGKRGGAGRNGWMMGPELDRAFLLVEKWALGEGDAPPICPPDLMTHWPDSVVALRTRPTVGMIDGFTWTARHTARQGRNLAARNIEIVLWTEAATTHSEMDFVRTRGRIVQSKGAIAMDAVPEAHNWVLTSVIEPAKKEAEELAAAATPKRSTYRVERFGILQNPWVDQVEAEAFRRDLARIDPRIAAREGDGDWTPDTLLFEYDGVRDSFDPVDEAADVMDFLGLEDVTEDAVGTYFLEAHNWLIAADINAHPHTSLIGKIGVPKGMRPVPANWHPVFTDCLQLWGMDSEQAAVELARYRGGIYRGAAVVMDATSMLARHNAGGVLNATRQIIPREAYERAGFEVRGPKRKAKGDDFVNAGTIDGTLTCRRILREGKVHVDRRRCIPFINALRRQEAEPDGVTPRKVSNTLQDRLIGAFTDCFRYWTQPFFSLPEYALDGEPLKVRTYG